MSLNAVVFYPMKNVISEERMFRVEQLHYTQVVPLDKIPLYRDMPDTPYVQAPYLGTYYYLISPSGRRLTIRFAMRKTLAYP